MVVQVSIKWNTAILVLQQVQGIVDAPFGQQFLVVAGFPHLALVQHYDIVRMLHCGQPVRYYQGSAVFCELGQGILYQELRLCIDI